MFIGFVSWGLHLVEGVAVTLGIMFIVGVRGNGQPASSDLEQIKETIIVCLGITITLIGILAAGLQILMEHKK